MFPSESFEPKNIGSVQHELRASDGSYARLLVVDDEPEVLNVLEKLLLSVGFKPEVFSDGQMLLDAVGENDFGCVLTDLKMPGLSGFDVQQKLGERSSCLSVVVLTANATVPSAIELMTKGAVTILEKPCKRAELCGAVKLAIESSFERLQKQDRKLNAIALLQTLDEDELQVLELAAKGLPNKAIATELSLSQRTVDRRRSSAMEKLKINTLADFALLKVTASGDL